MFLLWIYLAVAVGVSFLCSLVEASLLSMPRSHVALLAKGGSWVGREIDKMKSSIDRPLAAILTMNTCAHTVGAAGVGAQSLEVFGEAWVALTSAILTLVVLVFSEIIPKTIGATYASALTPFTVLTVKGMIFLTWPLVRALDFVSKIFKGDHKGEELTRDQISVMAEMAGAAGVLKRSEHSMIENVLALANERVESIMTPRTAVFMLPATMTVTEAMAEDNFQRFSRIPVFGDSPDDLRGVVLRYDLYEAARNGDGDKPVSDMLRKLRAVPETAPVLGVLEEFGRHGHHLFHVVDEYGGTAGIVTLEDVLETALGREIVDETDPVADMRTLVERRDDVAG
ncbi:MAG: hemolysin family protein [Planctomycetota bacterium]